MTASTDRPSFASALAAQDKEFDARHIGPTAEEVGQMLRTLGVTSLDALVEKVVPSAIQSEEVFAVAPFKAGMSERAALERIKALADKNQVWRSYLGCGYHGTLTPTVIVRNILENPGWYTQYTPYQPEIAQGRLEALLNFQTMIADLTGLPVANASLLDEATAAAEAMAVMKAVVGRKRKQANTFLVSEECHPQTIGVVRTRAEALGIIVEVAAITEATLNENHFGVLLQYPASTGAVSDPRAIIKAAHDQGALVTVAADLLSLAVLESPGALGADLVVGSAQRFGVPMGYGGPHAAFISASESYKRLLPGRIVGVSVDADGNPAYRLALQTREQHIRREKATSNICTAQVLLAIMASMYGVYHGPQGVKNIALRVQKATATLAKLLKEAGLTLAAETFFDTLQIPLAKAVLKEVRTRAEKAQINLRYLDDSVVISLDETVTATDLQDLYQVLTGKACEQAAYDAAASSTEAAGTPAGLERTTAYLQSEVFNRYHSETEFLRYVRRLESRDLSLCTSMIPLGSCTMKLNATSEMVPVTWPEFANIHPFVPEEQAAGYAQLFEELKQALADITGLPAVSLQPNAGSQGEYAGLLAIKSYLEAKGEAHRTICLIPTSAHGTNPASAVMAGMKVVPVACDEEGNISVEDLREKAEAHKESLAALMVTYPSTHGVFEASIKEVTAIVHDNGGQVYMDGANLNALVGLVKPGELGADVVHINLHKTFCIPHGGGGPGMGPIAAGAHLQAHLPGHPIINPEADTSVGPVSAAPWGSAAILPISWMYMAMMGTESLKRGSQIAILNANYLAAELGSDYPVLYRGQNDSVAHECILDFREFKKTAAIEVEDVAKRLMDFGFHAPTMSWPVPGTMMIEPTESESKEELDRFIAAMKAIRQEIAAIEAGALSKEDNPLKNAPHTAAMAVAGEWNHPYSREQAIFPSEETRSYKFWPACRRINNAYGDRNLVCTCPDMSEYEADAGADSAATKGSNSAAKSTVSKAA